MQSNEEVNLLCTLFLSLFFLSLGRLIRLVIFPFLKLLSMFMDMRTSTEASTSTWQMQGMLNNLSEL